MNSQFGTSLDYVVIVTYFIFILLFGSYFGRYTKTTKDFFFGGQRFSWWLIGFSCVATVVGSYSFIKYSSVGFQFGMSSSQGYLNDWIVLPFFALGWLPIIYFSRVQSIPEYFEKRFDRRTRVMATIIILLYLIGYIGINLLTLGVALQKVLGFPLMPTVTVIAIISGIYLHFGGQTAVIFTDLLQAFILIFAGFLLFGLGLAYLGGWGEFWGNLNLSHKLPFSDFNSPPKFHSAGIFWQDGIANNVAFYFMNQGIMMRFMSLKSVNEGRKAIFFVVLFLMPIAAWAIANAGWLGSALANKGMIDPATNPKDIFIVVANLVAAPGVFGFIIAALTAALMSTVDTLINAVSAVFVNDIYRPFIKKNDTKVSDKHYLKVAQIVAAGSAVVGVLLVPVFDSFKSIFVAHATFTAAITPPMVICIIFGAFWKRFTPIAAFYTLLGGAIIVLISIQFPQIISPFSHGVDPAGNFKYMRALFSLFACGSIAIVLTMFTKPKPLKEINGLVMGTIHKGMENFKGGKINTTRSRPIRSHLKAGKSEQIQLSAQQMKKLKVREGDLLYVRDKRWWYGGLKSLQAKVGNPHQKDGEVWIKKSLILDGHLTIGEEVVVEKLL